ncbi:hypothetical protein TRFO_14829 [Tritrichomonas foetus]|uniref:Uncharacterized protein n=1 Tax=Tritrichomonas foetus TaxID=1144522 RepID=A0A1J4KUB3_9EUKA|nr:hypothetical protein TRFO_14829 [Tritrichomonas foetus]|eukprot:OHT14859.1 hypothetical protein TRFO_14829 [Tritrichomonas foetus]
MTTNNQQDSQHFNSTSSNSSAHSFNSLVDFKNNVENYIRYSEARHAMSELYHGTPEEQWFLDEIMKCLVQLVNYQAGASLIKSLNDKLNYDYSIWNEAIFKSYLQLIKYGPGIDTLEKIINSKKQDTDTIRFIEDVLADLEKEKENNNFFLFFHKIIKIYKDEEFIKEILLSFDWINDPTGVKYLSIFTKYIPITEVSGIENFINSPEKYCDSEQNSSILTLLLSKENCEFVEKIMNSLCPILPQLIKSPFNYPLINQILDKANWKQLESVYVCFDNFLADVKEISSELEKLIVVLLSTMSFEFKCKFCEKHLYIFQTNTPKLKSILKCMEKKVSLITQKS